MTVLRKLRHDWILYIMLAPPLAYFVIFHLIPIFGMRLRFKIIGLLEIMCGLALSILMYCLVPLPFSPLLKIRSSSVQ